MDVAVRHCCHASGLASHFHASASSRVPSSSVSYAAASSPKLGTKFVPSLSRSKTFAQGSGRLVPRLVVRATADGGRNFQESFQEKAEQFSKNVSKTVSGAFSDLKSKAYQFERDNDISGKAKKAFRDTRYKLEELNDDLRRQAEKVNREYKVSEKVKGVADLASEQFRSTDEQWGLSRKWRVFSADFKSNWPRYQRNINAFLATPVGKLCTALFISWLFLSGIIFQLMFWSLWLFPFIPPLLRKFTQESVIQGTCPACGFRFVGPKSQMLTCRRCSGVVWQPKQDFSKNGNSPIIDIDLE